MQCLHVAYAITKVPERVLPARHQYSSSGLDPDKACRCTVQCGAVWIARLVGAKCPQASIRATPFPFVGDLPLGNKTLRMVACQHPCWLALPEQVWAAPLRPRTASI